MNLADNPACDRTLVKIKKFFGSGKLWMVVFFPYSVVTLWSTAWEDLLKCDWNSKRLLANRGRLMAPAVSNSVDWTSTTSSVFIAQLTPPTRWPARRTMRFVITTRARSFDGASCIHQCGLSLSVVQTNNFIKTLKRHHSQHVLTTHTKTHYSNEVNHSYMARKKENRKGERENGKQIWVGKGEMEKMKHNRTY